MKLIGFDYLLVDIKKIKKIEFRYLWVMELAKEEQVNPFELLKCWEEQICWDEKGGNQWIFQN